MDDRLTYDEAIAELDNWRDTVKNRDTQILRAHKAHVAKAEISRRMRIDRGTVIRVIAAYEASRGTEREAGE